MTGGGWSRWRAQPEGRCGAGAEGIRVAGGSAAAGLGAVGQRLRSPECPGQGRRPSSWGCRSHHGGVVRGGGSRWAPEMSGCHLLCGRRRKGPASLRSCCPHACLGPLLCSWIGRGHTNTRVAPALPAQVPGPVSDHHRPQALRLCRPGIHFSQLHHHRPGAAPDRGWQHCEWLGPSGKARDRQRGRPPGPAVGQGAGLRRLGEISKAGIREVGEAGNLPLGRGTSPWAAKWQPPLGAPWRKAEVSRWLGSSGSPRPMYFPAFSGTHLPHCVQLHLHSHLRGRDDAKGSPASPKTSPTPSWGMGPGPGPARPQPVNQQHRTGAPKPTPLGASSWALETQGSRVSARSLLARSSHAA